MNFLREVKGAGHEPFLVEFPEVCTAGYVPDLRHHKKGKDCKGLALCWLTLYYLTEEIWATFWAAFSK